MRFPHLRPFHFSFVDRAFRGSSGSPSASNSFELVRSDNVPAHNTPPPVFFSVLIPDLHAACNQRANDCNHRARVLTLPRTIVCFTRVCIFTIEQKKYRREYVKRVDKTRQHSARPCCFDCQQTSAIGIERTYNWFKTEIRMKNAREIVSETRRLQYFYPPVTWRRKK